MIWQPVNNNSNDVISINKDSATFGSEKSRSHRNLKFKLLETYKPTPPPDLFSLPLLTKL